MKNFIKNIIIFFLFALIFGEIVVRLTHVVSDLPQRTIDEYGIQKYYPNQSGYWIGGEHQWMINELGWPGELPKSYDNLINIIGDSFIENFMNPNSCHQSVFLKERIKEYNFIEFARSGVSFIEAFEISKQMDTLKPKYTLIYAGNGDFYESVSSISPMADVTQLNIENNTIVHGQMRSPGLKKILYNWKLLYYFYNTFPINLPGKGANSEKAIKKTPEKPGFKYTNEIQGLLDYIQLNYRIDDKILVFHTDTEKEIIEICEKAGFKYVLLNSENDDTWTFEYDSHWTCYGHEQVARQVSEKLKSEYLNF